ncbi:MAG TPA: hypothetical protein VFC78_12035 [Tepidisphaeraceae bacterium]|nr:hypothetical protein [Tepidisphaeraceae bacterium]
MNALNIWLNGLHASPLTQRLGWMLIHSVWQDTAIAALLAIALLLMRGAGSRARYALACAAMGLMVLLPILTPPPAEPAAAQARQETPLHLASARLEPAL